MSLKNYGHIKTETFFTTCLFKCLVNARFPLVPDPNVQSKNMKSKYKNIHYIHSIESGILNGSVSPMKRETYTVLCSPSLKFFTLGL